MSEDTINIIKEQCCFCIKENLSQSPFAVSVWISFQASFLKVTFAWDFFSFKYTQQVRKLPLLKIANTAIVLAGLESCAVCHLKYLKGLINFPKCYVFPVQRFFHMQWKGQILCYNCNFLMISKGGIIFTIGWGRGKTSKCSILCLSQKGYK